MKGFVTVPVYTLLIERSGAVTDGDGFTSVVMVKLVTK